jgi:hypothetical protein
LQRLETRTAPAGNVLAAVMNGVLYIAGDAADNSIRIQPAGIGEAMITPTDGTTAVNGQTGPVTLGGVNGVVSINLGDGNNHLEISGLSVNKELFIGTGSGNDTVSLSGVNVGKMLAIVTGAGLLRAPAAEAETTGPVISTTRSAAHAPVMQWTPRRSARRRRRMRRPLCRLMPVNARRPNRSPTGCWMA